MASGWCARRWLGTAPSFEKGSRILPAGVLDQQGKPAQTAERYFKMLEQNLAAKDSGELINRSLLNISQADAPIEMYQKVFGMLQSSRAQLDPRTVGKMVKNICAQDKVGLALGVARLAESHVGWNPEPIVFHGMIRRAIQMKDPMRAVGLVRELKHRGMPVPDNFMSYAQVFVEKNKHVSLDPEHYRNPNKLNEKVQRVERGYSAQLSEALAKNQLSRAQQIVAEAATKGAAVDSPVINNLIVALCKENKSQGALALAKTTKEINQASRVALINKLVESKNWKGGMELVQIFRKQGRFPGLHNLFNELCKANLLEEAQELVSIMKEAGQALEIRSYTIFINALTRAFQLELAENVFNEMVSKGIKPDAVSLGSMIKGYAEGNNMAKAVHYFESLEGYGVSPSPLIYNLLIKGHCQSSNFDAARALMAEMHTRGLKPDAFSYGTLIHGLCKGSRVSDAVESLKEFQDGGGVASVVIFNTLIKAYFDAGDRKTALSYFNLMKEQSIRPSNATFNIMLGGYRDKESSPEALQIFSEMENLAIAPSLASTHMLIQSLCQSGEVVKAHDVFLRVKKIGTKPDSGIYAELIRAHLATNDSKGAFQLLDTMRREQVTPSESIVSSLLETLPPEESEKAGELQSLLMTLRPDNNHA